MKLPKFSVRFSMPRLYALVNDLTCFYNIPSIKNYDRGNKISQKLQIGIFFRKITCTVSVFISFMVLSQKSAPVAGDAATLIDLLYKNYSANNPETLQEDIAKDRSKVISVFKVYCTNLSSDTSNISEDVENARLAYIKSQDIYNSALKDPNKELTELKTNFISDKNAYYKKIFAFDSLQLMALDNAYKGENKFISNIINKFCKKYENLNEGRYDVLALNNSSLSIQKGLPFTGGDILVEGIDGLSRFLAKRIKEELTLNALQNIQSYLKNEQEKAYLIEMEAVLPTTVNYLKSFDSDQILKFSDDLKQYIEQDLNNILKNSQNLRTSPRVILAIQKKPDIEFAFEGLDILNLVTKIKSPVDYFAILENSRNLNRWQNDVDPTKKAIARGLQVATMIAYSLTIVENGEVKFVTTDFISNYGSQKDFNFLYFGFLHQQHIKHFNIPGVSFNQLLEDSATNQLVMKTFIDGSVNLIVNRAERMHTQFTTIKKKKKNDEKVAYNEMHMLINDVVDFAEETTIAGDSLLTILNSEVYIRNFSDKLRPYFKVAHLANDISQDLHEKKFTNAIIKAVDIPLFLNITSVKSDNIFHSLKTRTEIFADLHSLTSVMSINDNMTDKDKLTVWELNKSNLRIIQLKFSNYDTLKDSGKELDILLLKITNENLKDFINLSKPLRDCLKTDRIAVLNYLGYDTELIKKEVIKKLKNKKVGKNIEHYIVSKLENYNVALYNNLLFGEEMGISTETELRDLYRAFADENMKSKDHKEKNYVVKFIHFVNDIAISENPDDYERAIEAFVLPVGSSSLKEKADYYYAISAYPGILGGLEKSKNISTAGFIGFTAPVGIYFQPWKSFKNKWTLGIFMPIIDIAAPVRLRLDNSNDTKTLPDFEVGDIFSPGFYLSLGMKNSPLAFNFGVQYGPKLRDITVENTSSLTSVESYRIGIGITLDIPLLTIGSKYKD